MIPCAYFSATLTQPIAIQVLLSLRPGRMNLAPKPMNMISDLREVVCGVIFVGTEENVCFRGVWG